ncbi:hypothetical protein CTI12_AA181750 [Artemisia annua]|uniref:HAT C-terminal dimerisation domain-containing protein n=1 Tax=Artemisia annua TaxID=35608 RepID=A0A2U1N735_ARTAN|nr:hypothetical protein CTI12_AA181750 [Artemisia annua]
MEPEFQVKEGQNNIYNLLGTNNLIFNAKNQATLKEVITHAFRLSVTLDPKKYFNADDICKLVTKYYPLDFTKQERIEFKLELQHFELDSDPELKNVRSLSALCRGLQKTEKLEMYPLTDRLIRLILTLPVSTATSERAFQG